jgi:hypothetical protein
MISRSLSAFLWRFFRRTRKPPAEVAALIVAAQRARAKHRRSKDIEAKMRAVRHALLGRELGKRV